MFSNYIFRSHMVGNIISLPKPLTENQLSTLIDYEARVLGSGKPLTENQKEVLTELRYKQIQSKKYELTTTAKKALNDIVFYTKYGRQALLENKYLTKGLVQEKGARDILSRLLNIPLVADEERRQNEWVTGKRDIMHPEVILDIKAKWDFESFNKSLIESTNDVYLWQLDCYMDLWGVKDSLLCHVLIDTPNDLVEREIKIKDYSLNILDMGGSVREEMIYEVKKIVCNSIYTRQGLESFCNQSPNVMIEWFDDFVEIPESARVHMIQHSYDKTRIEQRNEVIKIARTYMNSVKPLNNIIEII